MQPAAITYHQLEIQIAHQSPDRKLLSFGRFQMIKEPVLSVRRQGVSTGKKYSAKEDLDPTSRVIYLRGAR